MRRLALVGVVAALVACSSDSNGPGSSLAGTYHVASVGGHNLPTVVYTDGTSTITFVSGSATISANNTWSSTFAVHFVVTGSQNDQTFTGGGTWTQSGNTVTFLDTTDQSTFTATRSGNALTGQLDFGDPVGVKTIVFSK